MYVSSWPGITLQEFLPSHATRPLPYPLRSGNRLSFCVARSGIYHLFRALHLQESDIVLMPDYHSGNEVAAVRAAGASMVYYPIPLHRQKAYASGRYGVDSLPVTESLCKCVISLPISTETDEEQLACITENVLEFCRLHSSLNRPN